MIDKLGLLLPFQLTNSELPPAKTKRKRKVEVMKEVFLKEDIIVDGMHMNLTPPEGVIGKVGQEIKEREVGIFLYNGYFDLVFQRRSEYHLTIYDELIYKIESMPGFIEARNIVAKNLDGLD
ncbi:hypothetical protein Tco_0422267 [Tanacetum coccineum]